MKILGSSVALTLSAVRLAPPNTEHFRHPHQVGQRARGHFPHDMPAMDLDGNLAQPQFARDLFVHQAGGDQAHHLAFAFGQAVEACPQLRCSLLVLAPASIALERGGDRIQHVLIAKRLGQKIDRAGFHGLDRHRDVAVAGHEYDGNMDVRLGELGLEIEAAEPGQSHIEHEAACHVGKLASQQVRGRAERLDPETDRTKQASERFAHGFIVVDDKHGRLFGASERASWTLDHEILSGQQDLPAIDSTFARIIEPDNELRPDNPAALAFASLRMKAHRLFVAALNQGIKGIDRWVIESILKYSSSADRDEPISWATVKHWPSACRYCRN